MKNRKNISQRYLSHSAFTMIELVFVIVILGILASVAIPKFSATRTDAEISKGRADIASIRSAIMTERQSRLIRGDNAYITGTVMNTDGLFGGVLTYPITDSATAGHWTSTGTDAETKATYSYYVGSTAVAFSYSQTAQTINGVAHRAGTFLCKKTDTFCSELTD